MLSGGSHIVRTPPHLPPPLSREVGGEVRGITGVTVHVVLGPDWRSGVLTLFFFVPIGHLHTKEAGWTRRETQPHEQVLIHRGPDTEVLIHRGPVQRGPDTEVLTHRGSDTQRSCSERS